MKSQKTNLVLLNQMENITGLNNSTVHYLWIEEVKSQIYEIRSFRQKENMNRLEHETTTHFIVYKQ